MPQHQPLRTIFFKTGRTSVLLHTSVGFSGADVQCPCLSGWMRAVQRTRSTAAGILCLCTMYVLQPACMSTRGGVRHRGRAPVRPLAVESRTGPHVWWFANMRLRACAFYCPTSLSLSHLIFRLGKAVFNVENQVHTMQGILKPSI